MPEVNVDDRDWPLYRQCEIRRPSDRGYYFDVVWIRAELAKRGNNVRDGHGHDWTVYEVFGSKKLPGARGSFT